MLTQSKMELIGDELVRVGELIRALAPLHKAEILKRSVLADRIRVLANEIDPDPSPEAINARLLKDEVVTELYALGRRFAAWPDHES